MAIPPRVSVVIPTYNRAGLVMEAVRSVQAQDFADWEAIVVDDGSTDDTAARLAALAEPRLRLVPLAHSGKPAVARNRGAAEARGAWLAFLDSDDLWAPGKLSLQMAALEASGADWCYGGHDLIAPDGLFRPCRAGRYAPCDSAILPALVREETSAFIGTVVVRASLFAAAGGFDADLGESEDLDLVLRLAATGRAVALPGIVAHVREHAGRRTHGYRKPFDAPMTILERIAQQIDDADTLAVARRRHGDLLRAAVRRDLRRGRIVSAAVRRWKRRGRIRQPADRRSSR